MLNKPKILIFIDWYIPGFKAGGPIRSCANIVQHLSLDYEFYFITSDTDYCEDKPYDDVKPNKWNKLETGEHVFYISKENLNYSFIKKIVKTTDFDLVYVNGIYSRYFSIYPLLILKDSSKPVVVAIRGMLASSAINIKSFKKKPFLFIASLLGLYKNVVFHATNDKEKKDVLNAIKKTCKVLVAPNLHKVKIDKPIDYITKIPGELKLISLARISPEKNLAQLLELLALQKGEIRLDLYGTKYDEAYWKICKNTISKLPPNIKVNYCGAIDPIYIEETIEKYHFMSLLTLGENFGHVILESFMADRPVIISDQTPWKELSTKNVGWELDLNNNTILSKTLSHAVNMGQKEFNGMIDSVNNYAKELIKDERAINLTKALFNIKKTH